MIHQRPMTILIVEDDAATSALYADLLRMDGYHTHVVTSGQAALTALAQQPISAVLLDWRLPDMDGLAVSRQIRHTLHLGVPIVLITAHHSLALEAAARDAGVTVYFPKPMPAEMLLKRLATLSDG